MLSRGREGAGPPQHRRRRQAVLTPLPPPVPPWVAEKASRRTPERSLQDPGAGPAAVWFEAESWWLSAPGSLMADDGSRMGQGPRCPSGPRPLQVPSGPAEPQAHSPEHPAPAGRAKPSPPSPQRADVPSGPLGWHWTDSSAGQRTWFKSGRFPLSCRETWLGASAGVGTVWPVLQLGVTLRSLCLEILNRF